MGTGICSRLSRFDRLLTRTSSGTEVELGSVPVGVVTGTEEATSTGRGLVATMGPGMTSGVLAWVGLSEVR